MRGALAIVACLMAVPAGAAPVTFNYSLACTVNCARFGEGDAQVSITIDNANWTRFGRFFDNSALLDFSVTAGSYRARLADMEVWEFAGVWGTSRTAIPQFGVRASQNLFRENLPGYLTVSLFNPLYGDTRTAELGTGGSLVSMRDYAGYSSPVPIPVPPSGLLMAGVMLAAALRSCRRAVRRRARLAPAL